jgi:hypothetical protein
MKLPKLSSKTIFFSFLILLTAAVIILSLIPKPSALTPSPSVLPSPSPTPLPQELLEQTSQQTEDDQLYAQTQLEFINQHPWYKELPITTQNYRIVYDFDTQSFRIRLLTPGSAEELAAMKQASLNSLQAIGVDLNTYSYYFIEP